MTNVPLDNIERLRRQKYVSSWTRAAAVAGLSLAVLWLAESPTAAILTAIILGVHVVLSDIGHVWSNNMQAWTVYEASHQRMSQQIDRVVESLGNRPEGNQASEKTDPD